MRVQIALAVVVASSSRKKKTKEEEQYYWQLKNAHFIWVFDRQKLPTVEGTVTGGPE